MTSRYLCPLFWCYGIKLSRIQCTFCFFRISLNGRVGKRNSDASFCKDVGELKKGFHLFLLRCLIWKLPYFRSHSTSHWCTTVKGPKRVCVQLIRCVPWQMREDSPSNCWNTVALPSFMGQDGCALQRRRGRLNALGWLLMKSEDGVCHSAVIKTTSARHTLAHPKMFDCSWMWLWSRTLFLHTNMKEDNHSLILWGFSHPDL